MSVQPLLDYNDPEISARQSMAPNASCDVDGEYADVRNLMHLARKQSARIEALESAMELARAVLAQSITAGHNVPGPTPEDIERAFWALDDALTTPKAPTKEAMEPYLWQCKDYADGWIVHFSTEELKNLKQALTLAMASTMHNEAKALRDKIINIQAEAPEGDENVRT